MNFLIELRKRVLHCVLLLMGIFLVLAYFANPLYSFLAKPILKFLPKDHDLIAINIAAPIFIPYELAWMVSLFLVMPFFLFHLWRFIAPALYQKEKQMIFPLLFLSTVLFFLGIGFAYFMVLPILFKFLTHTVPFGVSISPDMTQYFEFTLKLLFIFGIIFEIPIATVLLIWSGLFSREKLILFRPYFIVGAFVVGMLVGPPDVLSQILLALPMWLLFELGIFLSKFWVR